MGAQLCKLYVTTGKCGYSIHLPSTSISSEYQQQGDRWLLELECGVVDAEFSVSSHCPHQLTMSLYPQWQTCTVSFSKDVFSQGAEYQVFLGVFLMFLAFFHSKKIWAKFHLGNFESYK